MTPIRSAHPSAIGPDAEERSLVYRKTEAGRQALAARRGHMALRDRQIVLLCTGERNVVAMTEVFGPDTPADLRRLVAAGLIEAAEPTAWPHVPPEFAPTLPPLGGVAATSANQSGFGITRVPDEDSLKAARAQAGVVLIEIGAEAAEKLDKDGADTQGEEDTLALLARAIGLAVRAWGDAEALPWAEQIARLLPRASIARLLDCLIDEDSAALVAPLYERLLSDSEFGAERGQ